MVTTKGHNLHCDPRLIRWRFTVVVTRLGIDIAAHIICDAVCDGRPLIDFAGYQPDQLPRRGPVGLMCHPTGHTHLLQSYAEYAA